MNPALRDIVLESGQAAPAFSPSDITNLVLWYDASDLATITKDASDFVSQWADKSTSAKHAVQANTNLQPKWLASGINGLPAIRGDGIDDIMTFTPFASGTNHNFYIVAAFDTVENQYTQYSGFFGSPSGSPAINDFRIDISANPSTVTRVPGLADMTLNAAGGANNPRSGIAAVYSYLRNGGSYRAKWTYGTMQSTTGTGGYATGPTANNRLFQNYFGAISFRIAEVLCYSRDLTAGEETQISDYFTSRYGVGL